MTHYSRSYRLCGIYPRRLYYFRISKGIAAIQSKWLRAIHFFFNDFREKNSLEKGIAQYFCIFLVYNIFKQNQLYLYRTENIYYSYPKCPASPKGHSDTCLAPVKNQLLDKKYDQKGKKFLER